MCLCILKLCAHTLKLCTLITGVGYSYLRVICFPVRVVCLHVRVMCSHQGITYRLHRYKNSAKQFFVYALNREDFLNSCLLLF